MMRIASISLQGKRPSQQDRILVAPGPRPAEGIVAAVADGLGGMLAGDKAAEIAVETLNQSALDVLKSMANNFAAASRSAVEVYQRANERIRTFAEAHYRQGAVGTTFTTLIISGDRFLVVNIGDSRCYMLDGAGVRQITQDHTVADALLQQGVLAPEDYESSPLRNQLTRTLGPKPDCEPDIFPPLDFGAITAGSAFLVCSDGFYSKLTDVDFMKLTAPSADLDAVLKGLCEVALERQSTDNLSAIALRL